MPKVFSSVINIVVLSQPKFDVNYEKLHRIVRTTFNQRRKMIRNTLKQITNNVDEILQFLNIQNNLRPENLSIKQFCDIANCI